MQELEQIFEREMRKNNLRVTNNRWAIFRILAKVDKPLSIREIIEISNKEGYFTSVYRSVESMTKIGILRAVPRGFKNLYELGEAFRLHHHHLTCEKCNCSIKIHAPRLEKMMHELTMQAGFTPTKHHFELFGICKKCRIKPINMV